MEALRQRKVWLAAAALILTLLIAAAVQLRYHVVTCSDPSLRNAHCVVLRRHGGGA